MAANCQSYCQERIEGPISKRKKRPLFSSSVHVKVRKRLIYVTVFAEYYRKSLRAFFLVTVLALEEQPNRNENEIKDCNCYPPN